MKIAIHKKEKSFSDYWIKCCEENAIAYKLVNCYDSDIISQLSDCDALMWHIHHADFLDMTVGKQIIAGIEHSGFPVFPNHNTLWHFDDKLAQKYLFESLGINHAQTTCFYSKWEALEWISTCSFPVVSKLRGGAGSSNVKLLKNKAQAKKQVNRSFGRGFNKFNRYDYFKERVRNVRNGREGVKSILKAFYRLFFSSAFGRAGMIEKGSVMFQEYVENNSYDVRVIVIGDKAFAIKRLVRDNDFRASGSGKILFEKENFPDAVIDQAFRVNEKLSSQCVALDFVFNTKGEAVLIEISYAFKPEPYFNCEGYWDRRLNFHRERITPFKWMIDDLIGSVSS